MKGEQDCSGLGGPAILPVPSPWPLDLCSQSSQWLCRSPFAVIAVALV